MISKCTPDFSWKEQVAKRIDSEKGEINAVVMPMDVTFYGGLSESVRLAHPTPLHLSGSA